MPASKLEKILATCPHCGHEQPEPRSVISTVCKNCRQHFRLGDLPKAAAASVRGPAVERKRITCSDCGAELEVAVNAQSTMCKRCSRHIDLLDYTITSAVSKNFKTKGTFVIEPKGYVFNTEAIVGDAVIKGRFLGKLVAERTLTICTGAEIKGSLSAGCLVVPSGNVFRWTLPIDAKSADIAGEVVGSLQVSETIYLRSSARMFGNMDAKNLVVEAGAIVVGEARIGTKRFQ